MRRWVRPSSKIRHLRAQLRSLHRRVGVARVVNDALDEECARKR